MITLKWNILFLVTLIVNSSAFSQDWRKSFDEGNKAFQQGDYGVALKHYRDAQDLAPENVNILDLINQSAYRSQNFSDAAAGYQEAAKRAQNANEKSQAHYNLGNAHFKNNNIDKAIESYKEALRNDPTNEKARYNLAYAMKQKENQENQDDNNDDNQDKDDDQNDGQNDDQNDNNEGDDDKNNDEKKSDDKEAKDGQSQPQQLSPDQAEQLLDALMRAEEDAKDKLDKEKDKGVPASEQKKKDW